MLIISKENDDEGKRILCGKYSRVKQTDRRCVGPKDSPLISSLSALLRQSQSISEAFSLLLGRHLFSPRILLTSQICFVLSSDGILNYQKKANVRQNGSEESKCLKAMSKIAC